MWSINDFKLGADPSNVQISEEITPQYYICKEKVDRYVAKTRMEEFRLKKMKGLSPSSEREDQIDFEVIYTPYFKMHGIHEIKHLRKNELQIPLKEDVIAFNIGESVFDISDLKHLDNNIYEINVMELVSHRNVGDAFLNDKGEPIKEKDIPEYRPIDEQLIEEILEKELIRTNINEKMLIENFKVSILKLAENNVRTIEENLTIDLHIILRARYIGIIKIKNKTKKMVIDSVTGD
ncbi:MAG: hypothetical protein ACTSVV_10455, partial [Promethearchaeota archaeon]